MREDAALAEGVELVLEELPQAGVCGGLDCGEEGRGVLLHQLVQLGPLGAVALVVERGTVRGPIIGASEVANLGPHSFPAWQSPRAAAGRIR